MCDICGFIIAKASIWAFRDGNRSPFAIGSIRNGPSMGIQDIPDLSTCVPHFVFLSHIKVLDRKQCLYHECSGLGTQGWVKGGCLPLSESFFKLSFILYSR